MTERRLSFVIPARNEAALIGESLDAILMSVARASGVDRADLWLPDTPFEVVVVNDGSEDDTETIVGSFADAAGVRLVQCAGRTCAAARNVGTAASSGRVLCFVDADTIVPEAAVDRILGHHEDEGRCLVLYRLASREPGVRAWIWWTFWGLARRLPLARAKSMPAFMSCDRTHFESYGRSRSPGRSPKSGPSPARPTAITPSDFSTTAASPPALPAGGWSSSPSDTPALF
jgi:glycosyltransferase involved in cell wall biosynthesis